MKVAAVFLTTVLVSSIAWSDDENGQLRARVDGLEELTLQQQDQIDQNTAAIATLGQGSGHGLVIVDSDGEVVGLPMEANRHEATLWIELDGYGDSLGVSPQGLHGTRYDLLFTTVDCSGTPHVQSSRFTSSSPTWKPPLIFGADTDPAARKAIRPAGPTADVPNTDLMSYRASWDGLCKDPWWHSQIEIWTIVPVEFFGPDFHQLYPPPYSLVSQ